MGDQNPNQGQEKSIAKSSSIIILASVFGVGICFALVGGLLGSIPTLLPNEPTGIIGEMKVFSARFEFLGEQ